MCAHFRSYSWCLSQFLRPFCRENKKIKFEVDNTDASLKKMCFLALTELCPASDTRALKAVTHVQAHEWLLFIELDMKSSSSDERWALRALKQTVPLVKDIQTQWGQVQSGEGPVRAWPGHVMLVLPHQCPKATTIHLWALWWGKSFRSAWWNLMEINLPKGRFFFPNTSL